MSNRFQKSGITEGGTAHTHSWWFERKEISFPCMSRVLWDWCVLASFPQPLHLPDDLWMSSSKASALVHSLRSDLQTAHTAFWGRKHSCRQLWQNLTVRWESKSVMWKLLQLPECHAAKFSTRETKPKAARLCPLRFSIFASNEHTDMKWREMTC